MRESIAALALIRREEAGHSLYLAQWNEAWQAWALVGGHKRPNESFRECVVREITEELGLRPDEFSVAETPLAQCEYTAWSRRTQSDTRYTIELFHVQLLGDQGQARIDANSANRWLTTDEIMAGHTADGAAISEALQRLTPAWE